MASLVRFILAAVFTLALAPFVGEFFVKWAEQNGFYDDPNARVTGIVSVVSAYHLYWPTVAFIGGLTVGAWLHWGATKFDLRKIKSDSGPELAPRSVLRLRFGANLEPPAAVFEENIESWFTYWSPSAKAEADNGKTLFEVPPSWAVFITFKKAVKYRQVRATFTGKNPASWQTYQPLPRSAILTITGPVPIGDMEISTQS